MTSHLIRSISNQPNHPLKPKLSIGASLINKLQRPEIQQMFQNKRQQTAASIDANIRRQMVASKTSQLTPERKLGEDIKHLSVYMEKDPLILTES